MECKTFNLYVPATRIQYCALGNPFIIAQSLNSSSLSCFPPLPIVDTNLTSGIYLAPFIILPISDTHLSSNATIFSGRFRTYRLHLGLNLPGVTEESNVKKTIVGKTSSPLKLSLLSTFTKRPQKEKICKCCLNLLVNLSELT